MRSPTVPLFIAAALGALAGLVTAAPAWPLAALALVTAGAALFTGKVLARAGALVALAFVLGAAGGAWQRTAHDMRARSLLSARPSSSAPAPELAAPGVVVPGDSGPGNEGWRRAVAFEGVVGDVTFGTSGARRLIVDVDGALPDRALDGTLLVTLPARVRDPVMPGDRIRVRGVPHALAPADSPGTFDERRFGIARGIDAALVVHHGALAVVEPGARAAPFARMRLWLRDRMASLLPPRMAGLELALLIGDTSMLGDAQREIYRRVGAGHLLAVSGLQVSLLAILLRQAALALVLATSFGRRGRGRTLASGVALAGVWAFVFLCGVPPSAVRAGAMATAVLAAPLFGRRARALDALGIAGLGTVLVSPASVVDPSFLLSYAAVIGLAATAPARAAGPDGGFARARRVAWSTVVASVGAGLVTLPLSAYLFGAVAPAGLVANIALVPAATILQVPALALGLAGAVTHVSFLAWLGGETALVLEALAAGFGDILPGVRPVDAPSGALTLLLLACTVVFAAALAQKKARAALACAAVAGVAVAVAAHEPDGVRITVLPVGQGDSAVFELPDGAVMVVDGGGTWDGRVDPGVNVVLPFLARRGIDHIDLMVLSHPHPDHALGLASVARAIPTDVIWTNGSGEALERIVTDAVPKTETTPAILGRHAFHGATLEVLAPAPQEKTSLYPELQANDNSLVLRVCRGDDCALWPGDVEALGEDLLLRSAYAKDVRAAVVKAPHHGSSTSSTEAFIRATGARDVIFCTGRGNTFGFPVAPVLARWRAAGARLWDTSVNGEITIVLTGNGVRIRSFIDAR